MRTLRFGGAADQWATEALFDASARVSLTAFATAVTSPYWWPGLPGPGWRGSGEQMGHADLLGLGIGVLIALATTPVGVSGAVFLLPVQLSLLNVPSPAVTPTNLLFNVVAVPGALARYRRAGHLNTPLARQMVAGTVPGVVLGALVRVVAVPGARVFHLLLAFALLPLGVWLCARSLRGAASAQDIPVREPSRRVVTALALGVGVVGGIYGIGGGSLLGPILVGRGLPMARVAPAALASTFLTSLAGALTYALLALTGRGNIAPDWQLGLMCGIGGLFGGYLGARLQPRLPERWLRLLLGAVAVALSVVYLVQGVA